MRRRIEPPFLVGVAEAPQKRQAKRALQFDREFAQQTAVVYGVGALRHRCQRYRPSLSAAKMRRTRRSASPLVVVEQDAVGSSPPPIQSHTAASVDGLLQERLECLEIELARPTRSGNTPRAPSRSSRPEPFSPSRSRAASRIRLASSGRGSDCWYACRSSSIRPTSGATKARVRCDRPSPSVPPAPGAPPGGMVTDSSQLRRAATLLVILPRDRSSGHETVV